MTTLVCLVSDQHIPNLLTVKAIRPDYLVLVITDRMKKKLPLFLDALAAGGLDYYRKYSVTEIKKENSFDEIRMSLTAAHASDPDREWILNITGGTKPMSIGAYMFAREHGFRALYIVENDQQNAIDLTGGKALSLAGQHVTTAEFLAGYGYKILNPRALERQNQQARDLMGLSALLTAHHDDRDLSNCLGRLQGMKGNANGNAWEKEKYNQYDKKGLVLSRDDPVFLRNSVIRKEIAQKFGLSEERENLIGHLDKKAAEFLTGKWLEYFVFGLLSPLEPEYVRCLQSGLSFGHSGDGENNELDVSFMTERKLCMIECKTGSQGYDPKGDQVIYKTEAIKDGIRALRATAFIATTSTNIFDDTGKVRQALANRSDAYECKIFDGKTLKELARMYLKKDPSLNERVIEQFNLKKPAILP